MPRLLASLVIVIALSLSACGFHLRGDIKLDATYSPLVIEADTLTLRQQQQIRRALERASTIVLDESVDANHLQVVILNSGLRNLARSNLNDVTLVQLTMTLQYRLLEANAKELTGWRDLTETIEIERDDANLLVQQQQMDEARRKLFDQLIQRMISGLRAPL